MTTRIVPNEPTKEMSDTPRTEFKRREWVGLTDDEMEELYYGNADSYGTERNFGRAVEAALKEKNGG